MTPAELHAAIVARVQDRLAPALALAQALADPAARAEQPWTIDVSGDQELIARMCQAALNRLERHKPVTTDGQKWFCRKCMPSWWPCPDVRDEATVWGVEVGGDG